ncbi:small nuclear ribonucleoprotein G-like [Eptesicus fuscus]|uniref:small nuclear ribonucleoprotein G-like n=1 Tax=Eptesicus fuscus TaxID=29078 RepID=UPI002403F1CB|nr:small nuclear ribonucleoprotein G-like [Eptesicus fuscus]
MGKAHPPELKKIMDKKLSLKLNGGSHVQGILQGCDPFMNLVIDECVEMATGGQQNSIGMVVIRGNSIIMLEALERVQRMAVFTKKSTASTCPLSTAPVSLQYKNLVLSIFTLNFC